MKNYRNITYIYIYTFYPAFPNVIIYHNHGTII